MTRISAAESQVMEALWADGPMGAEELVAALSRTQDWGGATVKTLINRLLKSEVSARFAPASVIAMGVFVLLLHFVALAWGKNDPGLTTLGNFVLHPMAGLMILALLGVAITGGMFVVPLYAFLTTTVPKTETARTVSARNIICTLGLESRPQYRSGIARCLGHRSHQ